MAKKSVIHRNKHRMKTVERFAEKRAQYKKAAVDMSLSEEARWEAQLKLQQLPRNASPIRLRRRCVLTGRPRGVYRKFHLSRMKLREHAMRGDIPGLVKASW